MIREYSVYVFAVLLVALNVWLWLKAGRQRKEHRDNVDIRRCITREGKGPDRRPRV